MTSQSQRLSGTEAETAISLDEGRGFVHRLRLERDSGPVPACLAMVELAPAELVGAADSLLHPGELEWAQALKFERRRHSYLLGRVAARLALRAFVGAGDTRSLRVEAGVFGQPVVVGTARRNAQVSISHNGNWGAAVAFSEHHPMGIDLEQVDKAGEGSIRSQCTKRERCLLDAIGLPCEEAAVMLWSMKESLSKILRSGLTSPLDTYEVESIRSDGDYHVGLFVRFAQYRSVSFRYRGMRCAVGLPKRTQWLTPAEALSDRMPGARGP